MPERPQGQENRPARDDERADDDSAIPDLDAQHADPHGGDIVITKRIDKSTPL